jgi:hypothetical protein
VIDIGGSPPKPLTISRSAIWWMSASKSGECIQRRFAVDNIEVSVEHPCECPFGDENVVICLVRVVNQQ